MLGDLLIALCVVCLPVFLFRRWREKRPWPRWAAIPTGCVIHILVWIGLTGFYTDMGPEWQGTAKIRPWNIAFIVALVLYQLLRFDFRAGASRYARKRVVESPPGSLSDDNASLPAVPVSSSEPEGQADAPEPNAEEPTRLCPFCAEEIRSAAIKCKHCGEWLNSGPPAPEAD